ncbi:MAG: ATPase, partial [Bacteroidales bacterium]|nr:ATPase [Bacteroidales bacterium]
MKTIILNQRKERDELMSRSYLVRRSNQDIDLLLNSSLIKLITGPRRVGKSTQALLMLRDKNFAYLNFDNYSLLETWDANLVMR